jgi:copper(I)-binding protein
MKMEGDVMRMRAIAGLDLPAGQKVELRPGGYHLMLMDLKQTLKKDTQISVVLRLQNAQGKFIDQPLTLPVLLRAPGLAGSGGAHSGHGGAHSGHGGSSGHRSH